MKTSLTRLKTKQFLEVRKGKTKWSIAIFRSINKLGPSGLVQYGKFFVYCTLFVSKTLIIVSNLKYSPVTQPIKQCSQKRARQMNSDNKDQCFE